MNIDCCKSYVGKQIIGLLPGGAEECLYVLAINAQDYGVSSFFGWLLNGNDFITELSNYGTVYEYQNDTGSQSVYVYYTGTQPTDLDVDILGTLTLFTIRKVTDFEGGSCDLVCYQASFDYGYEYRFIDYFATAPASPKFYGGGQPIDDDPSLYNQISIFLGPQITVTSVWNGSQYVITINNAFNLGGFKLGDGAPVYTTFTALPCEIVPPTPVPLALLDAYPGAGAAYSVRKLSSTYTGAALRIRRSSDNTEQDIGFVGFDLDTTALSSFVGAGNGFVTRWYDQTGNGRHMLQTTAGLQPTIVSSGSLIIRNGNLSILTCCFFRFLFLFHFYADLLFFILGLFQTRIDLQKYFFLVLGNLLLFQIGTDFYFDLLVLFLEILFLVIRFQMVVFLLLLNNENKLNLFFEKYFFLLIFSYF